MMAAEIENIFSATARSTWQFMTENGQGCYIPAYQRLYSWDRENISRLFEDALHGIRQIIARSDTISFIGTIIAIHDTKYQTVNPIYQTEVAPRVMTIIDGQQRISTIIMSNIVLHDYIRRAVNLFKGKTEIHLSWICDECTQMLVGLENTYLIDRTSGDGNYQYYPRIIRALSDVWSRKQGQAKYDSSVAKLIWEYINFTKAGNASQYKFHPVDSTGAVINDHKTVYETFRFIQRELKRICQSHYEEYDFSDLITATQQERFEGIWDFPIPDAVKSYVAEESSDRFYDDFCYLLRLLIFARYLNHRIAVTVVTARNEDDAFDMFEALNTTGEPLTAFETFRPKVTELETLSRYEHSPSYECMMQIEDYLNRYHKADDRQRATSEMLVSFALFETGHRLQKKLNAQRRYLRDEFDKLSNLNDIEKNRSFVQSLASVASFLRYGWGAEQDTKPDFYPLKIDNEEALVGIRVLKKLNHSVTIAPLSRFYQHALETEQEADRIKRIEDFVRAIKATVAFSVLWRSAMGGTRNIDKHYREIMHSGVNSENESIPPMARRPNGRLGVVSLANYKRALQLVLRDEGKIKNREDWVDQISKNAIYQHSQPLARFLVFCASDDAIPDELEKGLLTRGRQGINSLLTLSQWNDESYFTVEHIAPQSNGTGWGSDIYEEQQTIHTLGNLILLPKEENNIIGNRSWQHKKLMYRLLSAETEAEFEDLKTELKSFGLTLSKTANEVMQNAKYLGFCKSVTLYDGDWSRNIIEKRTRCFAELAWDRLKTWLF